MDKCSQCNNEAMFNIQGHLLCLDHYSVFSNNLRAQQMESIAMINYLSDSIERTMGVPSTGPRITQPQPPVIQHSPVTNNNIHIDRSVVGSINTAQVARIDVAMQNIDNGGNEKISKAIKILSEAIINDSKLAIDQKNQIIEQLTFLAEQATLPKGQQQITVVNMVLTAISATLGSIAQLSDLWTKYSHVIQQFFK